ncbi:helix-turn-helix transcriptional regulator [Bifidobacterium sp. MA2]|uniref:Helix-turn-helix transcriptional regulator n=1 Tax=Bifidobacterium santillanense TaxID=2809028 RepID=A0ABS5USG1_9BIFI|nr:helix-turn-helix transcriptional regulator [Bifidobacterium santillanense]
MTNQNRLDSEGIAKRISKLMRSRKVLQREVAEAIGMSEQVFSNKMTGLRNFTLKDTAALADVFEVSIDYLTGRIPNYWPDPWNPEEAKK